MRKYSYKIGMVLAGFVFMIGMGMLNPAEAQTGPFTMSGSQPTTDPFTLEAAVIPNSISPGGSARVVVTFAIAGGHKIYADRTSVTPGNVPGIIFGKNLKSQGVDKKEPDGTLARFYTDKAVVEVPFSVDDSAGEGTLKIPLAVRYQGCSETTCFFPQERQMEAVFTINAVQEGALTQISSSVSPPSEATTENMYQRTARRFGLIGVLAAAFLWGILASLTPCVYPMIPVTMSVIGASKAETAGRGFMLSVCYVLGMSLTYAGFGVAAAWSGTLFGAYADHPGVRIFVASVFVFLALAMFDLFHIQAPAWLASRLGGKRGAGVIGVSLTGAVAGMVVGPCVGPMLAGLLVYIATLGDKFQGFMIMWSFALGMGLLFLLVGTFSGAAASLPKSGKWMANLKYIFGVLMLGAALYYIHPLMPEKVFFLCLGSLLIGAGIFAKALDSLKAESTGYDRIIKTIGILCLTLGVVYTARFAAEDLISTPVHVNDLKKPGIVWYDNETVVLAWAREQNKPVMIDFTADWCAACQDLEAETFSHSEVIHMSSNYIPLRVDLSDPSAPESEKLRKKYGVVGLPTIAFLDPGGNVLSDQSITEFVKPEVLLKRMEQIKAKGK
jgi:thiol:disulfide interchange protein DsbD